MPPRPATGPDPSPDTSRRWLWLALLTGLLALLLAGAAVVRHRAPPTGPAAADAPRPLTTPSQFQTTRLVARACCL